MANSFDVAARLAEGRPAVDDVAEYVLACHRLGYQHQDLTVHSAQVRDWYGSEDGLDLRALDADCAALAGAAAAAEDAARTHTDLVAELAGAWSGRGAAAARDFAWRSAQAATAASSAVRGAADALAALQDELWRSVDAKVAAVQAIDARHRGERGAWLAASKTVTTGGEDLASASELVDQQVKPFVANDIGSDWLGAMRTATASIGAAYDAATASISRGPSAVFDVPGALGPRSEPSDVPPVTTPASAVASAPMMTGMPSAATTPVPSAAPVPSPGWAAPPPPAAAPLPVDPAASVPLAASSMPAAGTSMPSMGDAGGAAPALGSGVSGFGQQLADLIGGLIGSAGTEDLAGADASVDGLGDPPLDDPAAVDEVKKEADTETGPDTEGEPPPDGEPEVAVAEGAAPEPTAVPPPPAPEQPLAAPAAPESVTEAVGQTACEIAADEVPQVGE